MRALLRCYLPCSRSGAQCGSLRKRRHARPAGANQSLDRRHHRPFGVAPASRTANGCAAGPPAGQVGRQGAHPFHERHRKHGPRSAARHPAPSRGRLGRHAGRHPTTLRCEWQCGAREAGEPVRVPSVARTLAHRGGRRVHDQIRHPERPNCRRRPSQDHLLSDRRRAIDRVPESRAANLQGVRHRIPGHQRGLGRCI
jgi:hypothetical protein